MLWNQWYSLRSYVRSSLWIVPFAALLLYLVAIRLASRGRRLDRPDTAVALGLAVRRWCCKRSSR